MNKKGILSLLLLSLVLVLIIGCTPQGKPADKVPQEIEGNEIIPVAVKVDFITNETLEKLKAQGLMISDTEQSKTYGNVVFGTINKSKVKDLSGEVQEGVDEKEYKIEILKEIAIESHPSFQQNTRDLNLLTQSQVVLDEEREKKGITEGPIIEDQLLQRVEKEEFVPIYISFRIEAWNNSEQYGNEIRLQLGEDIKIELISWKGIKASINKEGLVKLMKKNYILLITTRLS